MREEGNPGNAAADSCLLEAGVHSQGQEGTPVRLADSPVGDRIQEDAQVVGRMVHSVPGSREGIPRILLEEDILQAVEGLRKEVGQAGTAPEEDPTVVEGHRDNHRLVVAPLDVHQAGVALGALEAAAAA